MAFVRAQIRIPNDTTGSVDEAINTLHFITDEAGSFEDEVTDIDTALAILLNAIDGELSENVGTPASIKYYNMEDDPDRVPVLETTVPLTVGVNSMPAQVACPVRLYAAYQSGQPRQRRRGRVFIGPLRSSAVIDTNGDVQIASASRDVIGNAFGALLPQFVGGASLSTIRLCVFSVSDALGLAVGATQPPDTGYTSLQLTGGFHPVTRVVIPDRLGVQRRRRTAVTQTTTYL